MGSHSKKFAEREEEFISRSGIPIKRLYTPEDMSQFNYAEDLGYPGEYPFTRGIYPTMYRGRIWSQRQLVGLGSGEDGNKRLRSLIDQGMTGISVVCDINLYWHEPDDPLVRNTLGKTGSVLTSLADWESYFDGIQLDKVRTSLNEVFCAIIPLAMYIALAEKRGIPLNKLSGTNQNDVLSSYHACHMKSSFPPKHSLRMVTDMIKFCCREIPNWHPLCITGYHMEEAGASPAQELAFTIADAIAYVEAGIAAGLRVDAFAPRLSFTFSCQNDFFEEVAKFRAARRLWAKIMKERFNAQDPRSYIMRYHAQTAGSTLTAQQPEVNIIRATIQSLAAVFGGCQSLQPCAMDEAFAIPTERTAQLSLRTQQVIEHETGIANTIDPLGGSYFVESLTDQIEAKAREYLDKIDNMGGLITAMEKGFIQKELAESAHRHQEEIETKKRIIVGVNDHTIEEEPEMELYHPPPELKDNVIAIYRKLKKERDKQKVKEALDNLRRVAQGGDNLVPATVAAVKTYAVITEIVGVFQEVFGEYEPMSIF